RVTLEALEALGVQLGVLEEHHRNGLEAVDDPFLGLLELRGGLFLVVATRRLVDELVELLVVVEPEVGSPRVVTLADVGAVEERLQEGAAVQPVPVGYPARGGDVPL